MQLALTQGALVRRLVVADIAPVAYAHDQTPHITAMRALDLTDLTSRSEADSRLSATGPFSIPQFRLIRAVLVPRCTGPGACSS